MRAKKPPSPVEFRQQRVELVQARRKPSELAESFFASLKRTHN